jgi:ArsR family metal-binding transcriptional regulator
MMKANSEIINLITNLIPEEFYVEADSTMSLIDKETKDQIIKLFDIDYISKEVIKSKLENNSTEQINNIKTEKINN